MALKEYLKGIADAIRAKKGTTELINAQNFANEIENLPDKFYNMLSRNGLYYSGLFAYKALTDAIRSYISQLDTSNVKFFDYCFYNTIGATSLDLSNWNTNNAELLNSMFEDSRYLQVIDLSNWNTSKVTQTRYMFKGLYRLHTVSGIIDLQSAYSVDGMFGTVQSNATEELININLKNLNTTGLNLRYCTELSHDSLLYLLQNAMVKSSSSTINLGATNLAKLTDEEKAIATNKGWTLA